MESSGYVARRILFEILDIATPIDERMNQFMSFSTIGWRVIPRNSVVPFSIDYPFVKLPVTNS